MKTTDIGGPPRSESEREYDISGVYASSLWFGGREFYITNTESPLIGGSSQIAVRNSQVIVSKCFEKIWIQVSKRDNLRRADYTSNNKSHSIWISKIDPNDFERSVFSIFQVKLNHLPKTDKISLHTAVNMWIRNLVIRNRVGDLQLGIESYQTKINLEHPNWDAADYYFKEDYRSSLS
ncbi:hypothetical protein Tco_0788423 [Tanacetum coccineum]